ncbi:BspA family leucine-rich repeat surface protein [Vagococcus zengguangii]|uniref:BspA family leucine-rich repeat surface protein n=1 Tax=Vagococcus zengguangii TaxID=2571750 RepID=A0A4D7CUH6_9ENTE|nr:BspA family leucine-rich repeat surface protein [Vagococcus zengguangii]QCI86884.1 BspA family leucine-rich repeat surface protein [Vagococcus zengguangii]TLG80490.1 BspA family leucine-rich repeat surface protein [Vagococcus zengguangii]
MKKTITYGVIASIVLQSIPLNVVAEEIQMDEDEIKTAQVEVPIEVSYIEDTLEKVNLNESEQLFQTENIETSSELDTELDSEKQTLTINNLDEIKEEISIESSSSLDLESNIEEVVVENDENSIELKESAANTNPIASKSDSKVIHQGEIGTSTWWILETGELQIGSGEISTPKFEVGVEGRGFWEDYSEIVTKVNFWNYDTNTPSSVKGLGNISYLFTMLTKVTTIEGLDRFNTTEVTNMSNLFSNCRSLTNIDINSLDTSNVTDMSYLFNRCESLKTIDVSMIDTSKVTNISYMFNLCKLLVELNVSSFDLTEVTSMRSSFRNCYQLENIIFGSFTTNNVIDMSYMFSGNKNMKEANLVSFETNNVTNMSYMFEKCENLNLINLTTFDTKKVKNMSAMFKGCSKINQLILGESFKFGDNSNLSSPGMLESSFPGYLTGKWMRQDGNSKAYTPTEFTQKYGEGDLLAGTYIAEVEYMHELEVNVQLTDDKITIGETTKVNATIENLTGYDDVEVTVELVNGVFEGIELLEETIEVKIDGKISQLNYQNLIEGIVIPKNSIVEFSYDLLGVNNEYYDNNIKVMLNQKGTEITNYVWTGVNSLTVDNGRIRFISKAPEVIGFKEWDNLMLDEITVQSRSFELKVEDLRGSNDVEENGIQGNRSSWRVEVSTDNVFINDEGKSDRGLFQLLGQTTDGSWCNAKDGVVLYEHNPIKEKPLDSKEQVIPVGEEQKLGIMLNQITGLKENSDYQVKIMFDLIDAP